MAQIYSEATSVIAWLGPAYDRSEIALDRLNRIAAQGSKRPFRVHLGQASGAPISLLCLRPYWRRLWIVQEIVLAKTVLLMCGDRIVPFALFRDFLLHILELKDLTKEHSSQRLRHSEGAEITIIPNSPAMNIVLLSQEDHVYSDMLSLMANTQHLRCVEPRDKVYALLGIAHEDFEELSLGYEIAIPALLINLLRLHQKANPPETIHEVVRHCDMLEEIFQLDAGDLFKLDHQEAYDEKQDDQGLLDFDFYPFNTGVSWPWIKVYGFSTLEDLYWREHENRLGDGLLNASRNGNVQALRFLLDEKNVDINMKLSNKRAVLCAASNGNLETFRFLIDRGATVYHHRSDFALITEALYGAIKSGHLFIVETLIQTGVLRFSSRSQIEQSFELACARGYSAVAGTLLSEVIRVSHEFLKVSSFEMYLESVVICCYKDVERRNIASEIAADWTHYSQMDRLRNAAEEVDRDLLVFLDKFKVNFRIEHETIRRTILTIVEALFEWGATAKEFTGSPLSLNMRHDQTDPVRSLLNFYLSDGWAGPLIEVARHGSVRLMEILLDYGVDAQGISSDVQYSLADGAKCGSIPTSVLQLDRRSRIGCRCQSQSTPLIEAVKHKNEKMVTWLVANGADINAIDSCGYTALHACVDRRSGSMMELLLENGADPSMKPTGSRSTETALELALRSDCPEQLKTLMSNPKYSIRSGHEAGLQMTGHAARAL